MKNKHFSQTQFTISKSMAGMQFFMLSCIISILLLIRPGASNAQGCFMTCPLANEPVQISLSANCIDTITAMDLIDPLPPMCNGPFTVELMHNGMSIDSVVTVDQIGDTLMVIVTDEDSDNNCMFTAVVLDKLPPSIMCPPDTLVSCFTNLDSLPQLTADSVMDCSDVEVFFFDDLVFSGSCMGDTISKFNRTYIVVDEYNNADTCVQMIWMERVDLVDVVFPPDFKADSALSCFPPPDTSPDATGYPTVDGFPIINGLVCNLSATYSDQIVDICSGSYKILRIWTVNDWCAGNIQIDSLQTIEVADTTAPELILPDTLEVAAGPGCDADVNLPAAMIIEDCSDPGLVDVRMETPAGTIFSNGGFLADVPAGVYDIIYIATNDCGVTGRDTLILEVNDQSFPTPVCRTAVVIPLNNEGMATVGAEVFSDGSYDNCSEVFFKVRRMDAPAGYTCATDDNPTNAFDDDIKFCCEDIAAGSITVVLRVYDSEPVEGPVADDYLEGHFSDCMVQVIIQDKIEPSITCPPDMTLSCEFPFDPGNLDIFGTIVTDPMLQQDICLDDPGNPGTNGLFCYGTDGLATDNCFVTVDTLSTTNINSTCGTGTITRTFIATDPGDLTAICTQTITFVDFTPFGLDSIEFPQDITISDECEIGELEPDDLPPPNNEPVLHRGSCDMVTFNHDDTFYDFSGTSQACFKILREWRVIDWCQYDPETGAGLWTDVQIIKVHNTVPPTVDPVMDLTVCTNDTLCGPGTVQLEATGSDECTDDVNLEWIVTIDLDNNLSLDDNIGPVSGPGVSFEYILPLGTHRILYSLEDLCGNVTTVEQFITMVSCKPPSAKCMDIILTLMPVDLNGDDTIDWGMITLNASQLDAGSDHACGNPVTIAFSDNPNDTVMTFECDDIGSNPVDMWVIDNNLNTDFCTAMVIIQDNAGHCPPLPPVQGGLIGGSVLTSDQRPLEEANINLAGSTLNPEHSDEEGKFLFPEMPFGDDYEVVPGKDGDDINGVSTIDLLIIQKHLLGIAPFQTPYQFIAADANHSGTISATDILELRKLILGITTELPATTSWRFLDAGYQFTDPANPLGEDFPESYMIAPFSTDMMAVDFVAVKIGDLNQSAETTANIQNVETRNASKDIVLSTLDMPLAAREQVRLPVTISDAGGVEAMQFTLTFDPSRIRLLGVEQGELQGDLVWSMHKIRDGYITISWFDTESIPDDKPRKFLNLIIQAGNNEVSPASVFAINSDLTEAEALRNNGTRPEIRWAGIELGGVAVEDQLILHQNRPNPFSDVSYIPFTVSGKGEVILIITNSYGEEVYRSRKQCSPGYNQFEIRASQLKHTGVLFYTVKTESSSQTNRMIIARNQGG